MGLWGGETVRDGLLLEASGTDCRWKRQLLGREGGGEGEGGLEPGGEFFFGEGGEVEEEEAFHGATREVHFASLGMGEEFGVAVGADSEHEVVFVGETTSHVSVDEKAEAAEHFLFGEVRDAGEVGAEAVGEEVVHRVGGVGWTDGLASFAKAWEARVGLLLEASATDCRWKRQLLFFLVFEEGEGADDEEDEEEDEAAPGDVGDGDVAEDDFGGFGFAFENPNGSKGGDGGGEDHEGVPDETGFALGAMFAKDLLGVHHEEEGEVGNGNQTATDDGGGDGEGCFGFGSPEDGEEATGESGESAAEEEEGFVVVDVRLSGRGACSFVAAEGFLEGEAVHEHEDDDGGDGHAEDADTEDFLGDGFACEGLKSDGEGSGVTLLQHVVEL